jgi:SAM-dependent methyltransferase
MLVNDTCTAYTEAQAVLGRELPPPPLGACAIPIVADYLKLIKPGMKVLDIGCGSWDTIKKYCERVGAEYQGIDTQTEYCGKPTIATKLENLAELSFADEYFDLVIGNQTMEHWGEFGCTLRWGLYQAFRVCKVQGKVLMNVPIHFHGTTVFMLGKLKTLEKLYAPFSQTVTFTKWGYPCDPLEVYIPHLGYQRLQNNPPYVLDIQAIKDRPLPKGYNNRGAVRGMLADFVNYPISYDIYWVTKVLKQYSLKEIIIRTLKRLTR